MATEERRGFLLIDKDTGPSSFHAIAALRRLFAIKKIGHAGTLDPFASGLLLLAFGRATSALERLSALDKAYEVTIRFGQKTDTADSEGRIVQTAKVDLARQLGEHGELLRAVLASLIGESWQTPPMYSAIKVDGQRLYQLARQGKEVERTPRLIRIDGAALLSLKQIDSSVDAVVSLQVSSGTYVRALAETIGERLQLPAHALALRRTRIGSFSVEDAVRLDRWFERFNQLGRDSQKFFLEQKEAGHLLPLRTAFSDLPVIILSNEEAKRAAHGQTLLVDASRLPSTMPVTSHNGEVWLVYNDGVEEVDVALAEISTVEETNVLKMRKVWIEHERIH